MHVIIHVNFVIPMGPMMNVHLVIVQVDKNLPWHQMELAH